MSEENRYGGAHLMLAFLAGAISGACVALLTAPQSGGETRATLHGLSRDAQARASRVPHAMRSAFQRASVAAKDAFTEALNEDSSETDSQEPA